MSDSNQTRTADRHSMGEGPNAADGQPRSIEELLVDYDIAKVKKLTRQWLDAPSRGTELI